MAYDLKKESDVKEYIDKLGVEYRFGCYSEKKPEGNKMPCYRPQKINSNLKILG